MKTRTRIILGWLALGWLVAAGCGPGDRGRGASRSEGTYGPLRESVSSTNSTGTAGSGSVESARAGTNAWLSVIETELSPATLWHSRSERVTLFGRMETRGLGGPTFLAYSSPTGITSLKPGSGVTGDQMRESWLMAGFAGAEGWTNWDSPWAVFLQRRPAEVRLEADGVEIRYEGAAGCFSMLPLYGYYKPPAKGQEVLKARGFKEKGMLTWEWPIVVARDPLTRLRYWAGVTRRFPVRSRDEFRVDRSRDTVVMRQSFEWLDVPDEWGTKLIRMAPVSPTLGLALVKGSTFPANFSVTPFDFEIATPYGPYFAVLNADSYEVEFPVLTYVNETEAPVVPLPSDAAPAVREALEKVRSLARDKFGDGTGNPPDLGTAMSGAVWYAKALPYLEGAVKSNVVASLGRYVKERVFGADGPKAGSGVGVGVGEFGPRAGRLLSLSWAYAHYSGDRGWVRERWSTIREWFQAPMETRWAGFGREDVAEIEEAAGGALAFARLAYLAGDAAAYELGCECVARELVALNARQRGAAWVREQQPWHSMEAMGEEIYLTRLGRDFSGWEMDGPGYPEGAGMRLHERRWVGFQDHDLARFFRENLGGEMAREMKSMAGRVDAKRRGQDDPLVGPSLVQLESMLRNTATSNLVVLATPDPFRGTATSGVIAGALAMIRSGAAPKWERLIPGAPAGAFRAGLGDGPAGMPGAGLVQRVETNGAGWPVVGGWRWRTPTGQAWTFGEVRAGPVERPAGAGAASALNRTSTRWDWK